MLLQGARCDPPAYQTCFSMNAEVDELQSVDVEDMVVPPMAPKLREDFKSLGGMISRLESESS